MFSKAGAITVPYYSSQICQPMYFGFLSLSCAVIFESQSSLLLSLDLIVVLYI